MNYLLTSLGVLAAVYIIFTLSMTGWAKLTTISNSAAQLRAEQSVFGGAVFSRLAVTALGVSEIGIAITAAIWPNSVVPPAGALGLFIVFTLYNVIQALQGRNDAPCTCGGSYASTSTTAIARAVANLISIGAVVLWAVTATAFPGMTQALFAIICCVPIAVLLIRLSSATASVKLGA